MKKRISILLASIILVTALFYIIMDDKNLTVFTLESKVLNAKSLSEKVVRLHVIANSDNEQDQAVKIKVKDAVLKEMAPKLNISDSKEETIEIIENNEDVIQQVAIDTLKKNNFNYSVKVAVDHTYFPTKFYNDFSLPAGDYLALRVIIGEGQGKNWWCVLFPPLCLVDLKQEKTAQTSVKESNNNNEVEDPESINEDTIDSDYGEKDNDNGEEDKVEVKWKTLEWLGFYK